jgi:hypothetical protein
LVSYKHAQQLLRPAVAPLDLQDGREPSGCDKASLLLSSIRLQVTQTGAKFKFGNFEEKSRSWQPKKGGSCHLGLPLAGCGGGVRGRGGAAGCQWGGGLGRRAGRLAERRSPTKHGCFGHCQVRSGQVRYMTRPKSETMRVTCKAAWATSKVSIDSDGLESSYSRILYSRSMSYSRALQLEMTSYAMTPVTRKACQKTGRCNFGRMRVQPSPPKPVTPTRSYLSSPSHVP